MTLTSLNDGQPLERAFLWSRALWKGIRPIVTAAVTTAALAVAEQVFSVDFLAKNGVPQFVAIGVFETWRNWRKHA